MIEHLHLGESDISVYQTAKQGNWCSGDSFFASFQKGFITCALADGLGSGEEAMYPSKLAMQIIEENPDLELLELIERCNNQMPGTRGVVLSILRIHISSKICEYVNVGNITCNFYYPDGSVVRPVPKRGYLSGRKMKLRVQTWPYESGMVFSMFSDGFSEDPLAKQSFCFEDTPEAIMSKISDRFDGVDDDATIMIGKAYI